MKTKFIIFLIALVTSASLAENYNYAEALQKSIYFYECQQSGELPSWNRVSWRGPSCVTDGSDVGVDLTGGLYDAGDHVKFNFPMAYTLTMLAWSVVEYRDAYENSNQLSHILNTITFISQYLIKCHTSDNEFYGQVGNGSDDHSFWGPAESVEFIMNRPSYKIDKSNPGSDLAGEAAAALAAASIVLKETNPNFASKCLDHSKTLYDFADNYRGKYSDVITDAQTFYKSWSGYKDELVWGAIWLYRATNDNSYLDKAELYYLDLSTEPQKTDKSYKWGLAWDDKGYGCYVLLATITGKGKYKSDTEHWLDYWSVGVNGEKINYTPGGLAWLDSWGANRYAANTAFCAFVYGDYIDDESLKSRYITFAKNQINYLLGDNPLSISYLIGMGENSPMRPHHRTCHGIYPSNDSDTGASKHILYGALVGGPKVDDSYADKRNDYFCNEVACDYNAGFTGAVARMYQEFGGEPINNFPPEEIATKEIYVEAGVNSSGDTYTEIKAILKNCTASPARSLSGLSYRYYLDLSEALNDGLSINEITVTKNYVQGIATVSDLIKYDKGEYIYYVEVNYSSDTLFPGTQDSYKRETQFRVSIPNNGNSINWNPSNDWSYTNINGNSDLVLAENIVVFLNGNQIYGALPNEEPVNKMQKNDNANNKLKAKTLFNNPEILKNGHCNIFSIDGRLMKTISVKEFLGTIETSNISKFHLSKGTFIATISYKGKRLLTRKFLFR